jgi:GNAT superfamily N-acetyltransferase
MRVRTAEPADAEALIAVFEWLFAPPGMPPPAWDPARALAAVRRVIESERSEIFLADEGGAIAGFCTVALDLDSIRYGRRAWVEDLAVDPERRSQGAGKALLDAAKDWARERGASHLELDSGDARVDAHRFYRREQPTWESRCFSWIL